MEDPQEGEAPRRSLPPGRSQVSMNWRTKDSTPRAANQSPRQGQYNSPRSQQSHRQQNDGQSHTPEPATPGTRLYVGNLLYTAQRSDVESLFTSSGFQISGLSMSIDPFTNRNPSYAFVDFETAEEAQQAMDQVNGMELLGRPVNVRPGVRKSDQGEGFERRVKDYSGRNVRESGGQVKNYSPSFNRSAPQSENYQPAQQGLRLYVGNLPRIEPQGAVDAEMQQLFDGYQITAVSKMVSPHPSKLQEGGEGNYYYCFVDLQSPEEVERAVEEVNGRQGSWGGEVKVGKARDNRERKGGREQGGRNGEPQERRGPPRGTQDGSWR